MPMTEWGKRRPGDSVVVSVGCRCPPRGGAGPAHLFGTLRDGAVWPARLSLSSPISRGCRTRRRGGDKSRPI